MTYNSSLREKEIENKLRDDLFKNYDTQSVLGNIDFAVAVPSPNSPQLFEKEYFLWAEAKKGTKYDINESFVQLILTIGKAKTFDYHLPPAFLGAFDAEKIAFIPYNAVLDIFYQNDFNWNVTPSDHSTKEFKQILDTVTKTLNDNSLLFNYKRDGKELERFIKQNFVVGKSKISKIRISKNNFVSIYQKWLVDVKPTIANVNWDIAKQLGIIDGDFFLADILSEHNITLKEKLFVLLRKDHYELDRRIDESGFFDSKKAQFSDGQKAHKKFWNRYNRPPKRVYWDYIAERRDLLVPQDVRERKGSYFTPQQWVELSQQYLAYELGENWQDEYYVWDCAAGTGNLLNGLTNKYKIWASTLDKADVDVIKERIKSGANLLESHVFQFDFLNDSFDKLPQGLSDIINDEKKRKKLVIYINPPYAEAANKQTVIGNGKNKANVAVQTMIYQRYKDKLGIAGRELYAQFMMRIYCEIPSSVLANFSTLKNLQAPNFHDFRKHFRAKLGRIFLVPADSFDNVKGKFPIGFHIWKTAEPSSFDHIIADVYNHDAQYIGPKTICYYDNDKTINDWIIKTRNQPHERPIGFMSAKGCDFQNVNYLYILNTKKQLPHPRGTIVTSRNLIEISIYFAVRKCIEATWINDRDQFLYPNDKWISDIEFQHDCLTYTLFNNNIQGHVVIGNLHYYNDWIPYTEDEVGAKDCFTSHFMSDYLSGKYQTNALFGSSESRPMHLKFSTEATAVLDAGRELWRYYHSHEDSCPDASLYDIKLYFQGIKMLKNGKMQMNSESEDLQYKSLIKILRERLKVLALKISPKIYEYGFLRK